MRSPRLSATAVFALLLASLAFGAASSSAAPPFQYNVEILPATFSGTAQGELAVSGLDATLTSTIRVMRAGVQQYRQDTPVGSDYVSIAAATITGGDVVQVYQGAAYPPSPPITPPLDTFTVPSVTATAAIGTNTVSGLAPDGAQVFFESRPTCYGERDSYPVTTSGGAFSLQVPGTVFYPGARVRIWAFPGAGNSVTFTDRSPGETPCLQVFATSTPATPGSLPEAKPFWVRATNMNPSVAPTARTVLLRGGAIIDDVSMAATTNFEFASAQQLLPGDVVQIFRPQAAPAPSASYTIPAYSGVFDPANSLAAVDSPGAIWMSVTLNRGYSNEYRNVRSVFQPAAGRTFFDFNQPQLYDPAVALQPGDRVSASVGSPPIGSLQYSFPLSQGDLVSPSVAIKLAKFLKLASLKSKLKLKLTSSEAASGKINLTVSRNLPKKGKLKVKKTTKTITIATATVNLKPGTNTVTLKITKAGKKAIKQLRGVGKRLKPQSAKLSGTLADASGNSAEISKSTKLRAK